MLLKKLRKYVIMLIPLIVLSFSQVSLAATDTTSGSLTDLFYTSAFSGSWSVFSKFNWLGFLLNFVITAFCLIGLMLVCYQRLVTLLYLSSRSLFDRIHEIKTAGKGGKILGLPGIIKDTISSANHGTGIDAIISFGLSLMPDVYAYSDYCAERRSYNLQDDDTVTTYMLKIAMPTILTIFFFSIGFNGTLFRAYGSVVSAMATAADKVIEEDLDATLTKWLNSGASYNFCFSDDGTELGNFKQKIAKSMYQKILAKSNDLTTANKQTIGSAIDTYVTSTVTAANLQTYAAGYDGSDKDVKNLQYSVCINSSQKISGELGGSGKAISDFGLSGTLKSPTASTKYYIHVFASKKADADETNYFEVNKKNLNSGSKNKKQPSTQSVE